MAKITEKETGRPNKSYKKLYMELKVKYEALLEKKVNEIQTNPKLSPVGDDKGALKTKKEDEAEKLPISKPSLDNQSNEDNDEEKEESDDSDEEKEESDEGEENLEVEENEEVNPDDYNYCCSNCKELFNDLKDGNKCPACDEDLENE